MGELSEGDKAIIEKIAAGVTKTILAEMGHDKMIADAILHHAESCVVKRRLRDVILVSVGISFGSGLVSGGFVLGLAKLFGIGG